jgi:hypothetical protein
MGPPRSVPPAPALARTIRWGLLALTAGVLTLAAPETWAAGVTVPSTTRLPATTRKSSRHTYSGGHRRKFRDCPTKRGGSNDQNGNGIDDRCDTGS